MRRSKFPIRKMLLPAILALGLVGVSCDGASDTPPEPAPNFTLTDTNADSPTYGQQRSLEDARGRVVVIHFALYT